MAPTIIPGIEIGRVIVKKTLKGEAPRVLAALSIFVSIISIANLMDRTINGNPIIAQAKTAPVHLNANVKLKFSSRNFPRGPFFPNKIKSKYPVTTGGSIKGKLIKLIKSFFNGKFFLANIKPNHIPNGKLVIAATVAILREITITLISSAEKLIIAHNKTPFCKNFFCFFILQEIVKINGFFFFI